MSPLHHPHRQAFASIFGLQTTAGGSGAFGDGTKGNRQVPQTDALSRVGGTALHESYQELAMSALRRGEPLSIALFGFDGWQTVARLYGWGVVERTMIEVTRALLSSFRGSDVVARWREDEIAVLLPRTDAVGGVRAAEKALRTLALSGSLQFAEGWVEVGVVAGVAPVEVGAPFLDAVDEASRQLHLARRTGPGRIRWSGGEVVALGGRIAVIDPNGVLERCSELFLRLGGEVVAVPDVASWLDSGSKGLALIVLVQDTDAHGFRELQQLREDVSLRDCPVVVIGAHHDELPISFELGADDFLVHPVAPMELGARIRRLIGRRRLYPPSHT